VNVYTHTHTHTHTHNGDLCIYYSVISLQELFRSYYISSPQKQNSFSLLCSREVEDHKKGEETRVRYECVDKVLLKNVKDISNSHETERRFFHPRPKLLCSHYTLPLIDVSPHDSPAPERDIWVC